MKRPPKKGTITAEPIVRRDGDAIVIDIPMALRHRGGRKVIVLPPGVAPAVDDDRKQPAPTALTLALARAFRWQQMIETGEAASNCDLARKLDLDPSYIARTIRLTSLAPDLIEATLDGQEPESLPQQSSLAGRSTAKPQARRCLSLLSLRHPLPLAWEEQRRMLAK